MDGKKQERGSDFVLHDFALVTTYLPVLGITLRAKMLVCLVYWCLYTVRLHFAAVTMFCASVVYIDAILFLSHVDQACGHLTLAGLAVLTQQHNHECSDAGVVALVVCDLVWSVCTSAEVCSSLFTWRVQVLPVIKVFAACCFACTHVLFACTAASMMEMIGRAILFYILCSLVVLCSPFTPHQDRSKQHVLLVCAPVLFVHVYIAVAGVLLLVSVHAYLIYSNVRCAEVKRQSVQSCHTLESRSSKQNEQMDLTAKLLAAKRMHGMA